MRRKAGEGREGENVLGRFEMTKNGASERACDGGEVRRYCGMGWDGCGGGGGAGGLGVELGGEGSVG